MKLNCLIVDDEPMARKGLAEYIHEVDFLYLAGECENAVKALSFIQSGEIDLLFLDIHMPGPSGIEFLKSLENPPLVIITTANPEYALEGYSLAVLDYLVKPVPFVRFLKAVQKATDFYALKQKANATTTSAGYFFIKCNGLLEKVHYAEILYIEAMQNYCIIHTAERKFITHITFVRLMHQLPSDCFLKVHKSFLISLSKVQAVEGNEILIARARIPISRSLKDEVLKRIVGNNLLKGS